MSSKPPQPRVTEKPRILAFTTVEFEDNDWDGPKLEGDFAAYTSKTAAASLRVTLNGKAIFDSDFPRGKTFYTSVNVIHLPQGPIGEK
jgi:hypothetical protein